MFKDIRTILFRFVILIFFQVVVLNHIHIGGLCNPYVYVWFILFLPYRIHPSLLLLLSFATGLIIDLFTQTIGMHTFACVLTGYLRHLMQKSATASEHDRGRFPSLHKAGFKWFFNYTATLVLAHHCCLFLIETFAWADFGLALVRAFFSAVLTVAFIFACEILFTEKS